MKIALLISGYLRSFKINIDKLKMNLLEDNDIDIYIHITSNCESKYINNSITIDEINTLIKPKIMIVSNNFEFKLNNNDTNKLNNINNIYNQNYKFYILNQKRMEIEKIENFKYDVIIKFRPDIYLQEKINLNIEKDIIYIPNDSKIDKSKLFNINDKYLCDIIAYGDSNIMTKYFDFYLHLDRLINSYGNVNETLLYHYLNDNNLKYENINLDYIVILSLINTIAISGDSGTGKTTLSNIIQKIFTNSFVLECDRYHKWERNNPKWSLLTHLNPEANYITKMNNDVFDLKIGNNIYQVDYDHKTGKFTDLENIKSKENIIVCGLHSLYVTDCYIDLKIYLDISENIKIPWKIKRDIHKRGYTIDKILNQIENRKEDFINFIYPQKFKADIIISLYNDNSINYEDVDLSKDVRYEYKIGINNKYNINKFINQLSDVEKIDKEDLIYYFHFNKNKTLEQSITNIIIIFFNA